MVGMVMTVPASESYRTGGTVFFLPITRNLRLGRSHLDCLCSGQILEGGLGGPLVGYPVDRFDPRRVASFGGVMSGVGFPLISQSRIYVVFMLV